MSFSLSGRRPATLILWLLCALALPIWVHYDAPAWDVGIYLQAVHSLKAGHDPLILHGQRTKQSDLLVTVSVVDFVIALEVNR